MKKLTALLLALVLVLGLAACAPAANTEGTTTNNTENNTDNAEVMTYAEYAAAADGSVVTVEFYVQDTQGWWFNNDPAVNSGVITVYGQDKDGGYFAYDLRCEEADAAKLTPGTKICVTGDKATWNGEVEVMNGTFTFVDEADTYVAPAKDITALIGKDELADSINQFITIKGATVVASSNTVGAETAILYNWDGSGKQGDDVYFTVSVGEAKLTVCIETYLRGADSDVYKAAEALKIGDKIDLEGFLYYYNDAQPHITAIKAAA